MAITCPACGRANDDDASFCSGCAAELPVRCSSCGASLAPDAVFCRSCGSQVGRGGAGLTRPAAPAPGIEDTQIEPRAGAGGAAARPAAPQGPAGPVPAAAPTVYAGPGPERPFAPPPAPTPGQGGAAAAGAAQVPSRAPAPDAGRPASVVPAGSPPQGPPPVTPYGGAPQGPPPVVPPPPAPSSGGGGGRRRGLPVWLLVLVILAVVAAAAAVAFALLRPGGGGEKHASASPSASSSPSPSASASPSVSPTASPSPGAAGFPMAVAGGRKGNILTTVDADGATVPLSGKLGTQVFQVAWSPDGRRLACVAGDWESARLWLADVEAGSVKELVVSEPAVVAVDSVAWLSATQILVAGYTTTPSFQGEVGELVVCDAETGSVVGPLQDGSGASLRGISVSSSADGGRVAYVTYTDQKTNSYGAATASERLELLDRNSGAVTELGIGKAFFEVNARRFDEPLISPDGNAVIFRQAGSDVGTSYTVVDANGTTVMHSKELTFPAGYAWDPSGEKVVFTGHSVSSNGGKNDYVTFYVFDRAEGGRPQRIATYKNTMVQELSWSPDGATIAFAEWDRKNYSTGIVYQLSASGGDAHTLVRDALFPAYRPAGSTP